MTVPFAIAVKSFIVDDGRLLLLKRRPDDSHKPGAWDVPGGRISPGENPYDGLRRETREETSLDIEPVCPLGVHHFTRDDGQRITMIIFYCRPLGKDVRLSEEHVDHRWADLVGEAESIPVWLKNEVMTWRRMEK